ncbi:MAG: transglycosylase SLT domain-containing protein, partial [Pyrinomonadaceae bacterium]
MKTLLAAFVTTVLLSSFVFSQASDAALRRAMRLDNDQRDTNGKLPTLDAAEHLLRAETYMANRLFPQAREHWQIVFDTFPNDVGIHKAFFGTARSYMWGRQYEKAVFWFEKLNGNTSKEGREGLAFKGASLVRLGKDLDAAKVYEQYVQYFPQGERIESAHLNLIDAYREAGKYDEAERWIDKTVARFGGKAAEVNALHARLRMEIYRERWNEAIAAAAMLLIGKSFSGAMTGADEIRFLRAFALEKAGRKQQSTEAYASIPDSFSSYYGGLAAARLAKNGSKASFVSPTSQQSSDSPVMYRAELLQSAKKFDIDPRFLLAIMKQESSFKSAAKSPAGARGLLQLVYDTAIKYKSKAGYPNLQPDQLYYPSVNIAVGVIA